MCLYISGYNITFSRNHPGGGADSGPGIYPTSAAHPDHRSHAGLQLTQVLLCTIHWLPAAAPVRHLHIWDMVKHTLQPVNYMLCYFQSAYFSPGERGSKINCLLSRPIENPKTRNVSLTVTKCNSASSHVSWDNVSSMEVQGLALLASQHEGPGFESSRGRAFLCTFLFISWTELADWRWHWSSAVKILSSGLSFSGCVSSTPKCGCVKMYLYIYSH